VVQVWFFCSFQLSVCSKERRQKKSAQSSLLFARRAGAPPAQEPAIPVLPHAMSPTILLIRLCLSTASKVPWLSSFPGASVHGGQQVVVRGSGSSSAGERVWQGYVAKAEALQCSAAGAVVVECPACLPSHEPGKSASVCRA